MNRPRVVVTKDDDELEEEIDQERLDLLLSKRRGSVDSRKSQSWMQRLNPRYVFSRGSRSGTQSPIQHSRLNEVKDDNQKRPGRSKSIDLGGTLISPLHSLGARRMFVADEEIVEGVQSNYKSEVDREVQSITSRRIVAQPPPGTVEYTVCSRESLASIAAKHKSTTSELIKINRMMSSLVFPGQKLFVPTEDYVPMGYGSQKSSPRSSPINTLFAEYADGLAPRLKSLDPDDSKKLKKTNRLKDRRQSDSTTKVKRNFFQKDDVIFTARVDYVTGGKDPNISGMLEICRNEVKFEPDMTENDKALLKDLVRYRMSLGKAMVAANIIDTNPYSQTEERKLESDEGPSNQAPDSEAKSSGPIDATPEASATGDAKEATEKAESNGEGLNSWTDDFLAGQKVITFRVNDSEETEGEKKDGVDETEVEKTKEELNKLAVDAEGADSVVVKSSSALRSESSSPQPSVKYLLVKLGIPSRATKDRPTISSLIRVCLPITETATVEHCFVIPEHIVPDLNDFLQKNYPDVYGKTEAESADRFDALDDLMRPRPSTGAAPFKRSLSIAEFCHLPLPEMSAESSILKETHVRILREHLLPSSEGRPWKLVYSSSVHGYSINTLYRSMAKTDLTTMLVIADMSEKVFGAMLPCSIRQSEGFYGNGESFLFSFFPVFKKFCWSGKNNYFVKGNQSNFYIGASDGVFGLWLHDDLNHGRTQRCETYDNDLLTETTEDFYIRCVEVWQFPFSLEEL